MAIDRRDFLNNAGALGLAAMAVPSGMAQAQESGSAAGDVGGLNVPFTGVSEFGKNPNMEFAFEIDLDFTRTQNIENMPTGGGRGVVYLDGGTVRGPLLNGKAVPDSGGDWSSFRPDGVLSFDARYMLEANDGTLILLRNHGFLWGRETDTMDKIRAWIFDGGPEVPHSEYYLRCSPRFEVESGKYDWLMRHVFVGVGTRKEHGNTIRYYALL